MDKMAKRYKVYFGLLGNDLELIESHDNYYDAITSVIETNKIVKSMRSSKFEIKDSQSGNITYFECNDMGISINAKLAEIV